MSSVAGGALTGGLSGAGTGAAIGSVIPGIGTAIGAGVGGLIGAVGGGLAGRRKSQETETQRKQRELVDEMLMSLRGEGPYSDLFTANEADFERSFAEPARQRFRTQTAPQIQQSYIAQGQQRSTGLDDTLARAGVDMDTLLNQQYMDYLQNAQTRKANAITGILGQGAGAAPEQGYGEAALQGLAGYAAKPEFQKSIEDILGAYGQRKKDNEYDPYAQPRKGFENDNIFNSPIVGAQS